MEVRGRRARSLRRRAAQPVGITLSPGAAQGRDPEARRRAIIAAALEAIARDGYDNVTHRRIAELADVPLGSTTYYFPTLPDLLGEAVELARREAADWVAEVAEEVSTADDLAPAIAAAAERYIESGRDAALIDLEVYMASARDERLRSASREWTDSLHELIEPLASAEAAQSVTALLDGYLTAAVIGGSLDRDALERAIARQLS